MFFKARKVSQLPSSRTLANAAMVDYIRPVYQLEERIKALWEQYAGRGEVLPLEAVRALRQEKSKPILEKFKAWVDELLPWNVKAVLDEQKKKSLEDQKNQQQSAA